MAQSWEECVSVLDLWRIHCAGYSFKISCITGKGIQINDKIMFTMSVGGQ